MTITSLVIPLPTKRRATCAVCGRPFEPRYYRRKTDGAQVYSTTCQRSCANRQIARERRAVA